MAKAVRFDDYGPVDNLYVADVDIPTPTGEDVVVRVVATSINPGEIMIREGAMRETAPSTFPSGQGSDLAGYVHAVGPDVRGWSVGDEVFGWTDDRAAQAEYVVVPEDQLSIRPPGVSWDELASLYVAGGTAHALVQAVAPQSGETVLVSGAAGGVGGIVVQLLRRLDVRVLGIAGDGNAEWLRSVGVEPVAYGDRLGHRLRELAPEGIDAAIDTHGDGYVQLAVGHDVPPHRVATIIDFDEGEKLGAQVIFGYEFASAGVMTELAEMIAAGEVTIPIAGRYPLADVRAAYTELAQRHTRGKIVLAVSEPDHD